jgi:hypothetical protein
VISLIEGIHAIVDDKNEIDISMATALIAFFLANSLLIIISILLK